MVSWPGNIAWVSVVFVAILISECIIMRKIDVKLVDEMMVTVCVYVCVRLSSATWLKAKPFSPV